MIKINCAATPETLLESELFGYVRGAFIGAVRGKPSRFQMADRGTFSLDEISEVYMAGPADQAFTCAGGQGTLPPGQAGHGQGRHAQHRRLQQTPAEPGRGRVLPRGSLFYRLNVIRVVVVPLLRERRWDVPFLIRHLIQLKKLERGTYICRFSLETIDILLNYDYPGNVREMENILEHAYFCFTGAISFNCTTCPEVCTRPRARTPAPANGLFGPPRK